MNKPNWTMEQPPPELPRYVVQFPEGERELDALEIVDEFRDFKLNTTSLIRPAAGGEWRELGQEPGLISKECYKQVSVSVRGIFFTDLILWLLPFLILFPLMFMGSASFFSNWQFLLLNFSISVFFLSWLGVGKMYKAPGERDNREIWMIVPYLNCYIGYRSIQDHLPDSARVRRVWNPLAWLWLAGCFIATWFLPGTAEGGIAIFAALGIFQLMLGVLLLPRLSEVSKRARIWKANNAPPPKCEQNPLLTKLIRRRNSGALWRCAGMFILCVPVALIMLFGPYWVVGALRLRYIKYELAGEYIPLDVQTYFVPAAAPNAAAEIMTIPIPDVDTEYFPLEDISDATHPELRPKLEEIRPQLDQFRHMLRQYGRLGIALRFSDRPPLDVAHKRIWAYLFWRRIELALNPEMSCQDWWLDFARCREYELNENPYEGMFAELRYANWYNAVLEKRLARLSTAEVDREKKRVLQYIDALPGGVKRYIYADHILDTYLIQRTFKIPFCFRDNVAATALQRAHEETQAISGEWYENHERYRELMERESRRGGIYSFELGNAKDIRNLLYSRTLAAYRLALAALELEQYRRATGSLPEKPILPRDPFDGRPLRYVPGKQIHSVGQPGKEDKNLIFHLPKEMQ